MGPVRSTALALALLAGAAAHGATVDARVTSLAGLRPQIIDGEAVTTASILEAVTVRASDIQTPIADDLKVLLSAWGALGPGPRAEPTVNGDVDLAFVEGRLFKKHLRVRIGRQSLVGGVARVSYLDGLALDLFAPYGLGASFAVGVPVGPRFSLIASGQWQINARVQVAPQPWIWNLGLSFIHVGDRAGTARQEVGLDGRVYLFRSLTLAGAAMFSIPDKKFSEIDLGPRWQPVDNFELSAGYRRTAPDLLIPRTSIFSVFSDTSRDEVGGSVFWAPASFLSLYADARGLFIDDEKGVDVSARVSFRRGRAHKTSSLTLMGRWLRLPSNGYLQGRVSATHQLKAGLGLSAEFDIFYFDQAINGERFSYSGSGSLTYAISHQWYVAFSVLGATSPTWATRVETFARLVWTIPSNEVDL